MAILKYFNGGHYHDANSRQDVINYILRPDKTPDGYIGYIGVNPHDICGSMQHTAAEANKDSGVRIRHMALNFSPAELTDPAIADEIGQSVMKYIGKDFQTVYAVHQDTEHLNIHFVFNAVSYIDGHRYKGRKNEYRPCEKHIRDILSDYGIFKFSSCSRQAALCEYSD